MVYYKKCMHEQTAFSALSDHVCDYPVASRLAGRVFSLPMHPYMSKPDQEKIIGSLIEVAQLKSLTRK